MFVIGFFLLISLSNWKSIVIFAYVIDPTIWRKNITMKAIFENNNELIYTALYNYQDVTFEQGNAIKSVISISDMAYEWYKKTDITFCENEKYFGIVVTTQTKKFLSECGAFDLIDNVEKFYIKQEVINYIDTLNNWKHQLNTLRKYLKRK